MYVITPKMTGFYSIAEIADDSNKWPEKTLFCYLTTDEDCEFTKAQLKSLSATSKLVSNNGGKVFENLAEIARFLNTFMDQSGLDITTNH